jgi:hypothetical protein
MAANGDYTFTPAPDYNGAVPLVTYTLTDGSGTDDTSTLSITVDPANDPPVIPVPTPLNLDEGTSATITDAELIVTDVDTSADQLNYTVTAAPTNGFLALASAPAVPVLAFTQEDIDLNELKYVHDGSETTSDAFTFTVTDDGGNTVGPQLFMFSIAAVNDPPENTVPGDQVIAEDTSIIFSGVDRISVADPDLPGGDMEVKLIASHGTLQLATTAGLSFLIGTGTGGDAVLEFTGTATDINAALNGLELVPTTDFNGVSTLTIQTDDKGYSGSGTPLTDTDVITITVTPTPDNPFATHDPGSFNSTLTALSPISYWRLGETVPGPLIDSGTAGNDAANNGIILGGPGAISGDADGAIHVDAPGYIEIAHDPAYMLDDGTVQMWFKLDAIVGVQTLFSKDATTFLNGGHLDISVQNDGRVEVRLQSVGSENFVNSPGAVSAGRWYHVAFSFGSQGMALYLDGQLVDSNTYAGGLGADNPRREFDEQRARCCNPGHQLHARRPGRGSNFRRRIERGPDRRPVRGRRTKLRNH